ncbi:MAG: Bax inhibitor-1/YccA family protein [Pseudoflavonifractor sp.]|nr:Bax inhibitor-1/YccA family protein [Pseudoflavonifractor sp.]
MENFNVNAYNTPTLDNQVSQVMKRVYVKMFLALLVTSFTAWVIGSSTSFIYYMATHSWVYWGLMLLELGMVIAISAALNKMSSAMATTLFYLFAVVNGAVFSIILSVYTTDSIFKTFLITAGVFGAMSVYGYFTDRDLTKVGTFLYMALWGLVIAIVVNIFWANNTLEWIISIAGVLIFVGLTAWDTQKIKQMAAQMPNATDGRLATLGALSLYLDFINLFLYLLRFFGNSRD